MGDQPQLPDYGGACISNVVPALLERPDAPPEWLPEPVLGADQVVLFLLDGLGWEQLLARRDLTPNLSSMVGAPITSVVPTTTAAALTSLTTGEPPGEHGIVGYRIHVHGEVLNVLRWTTAAGDARHTIPPQKIQNHLSFLGHRPPVITRAEFARSGFTAAHLDGVRFTGYRMTSTLVTEVRRAVAAGEPFVYAYYDGVDKVAHEYGLGEHYDAELRAVDDLVGQLADAMPPGATLLVTSDHGQVHTADNVVPVHGEVMTHVSLQSGEGRFRWLHARPGRVSALYDAAVAHHGDQAWVVSREDIAAGGWLGPHLSTDGASRLGDVALVAKGAVAFSEPTDTGPYHLIGRHGSVTAAELWVPLLASAH